MMRSDHSQQPLDREAQLANRVTVLTLASLCAFLLALIAMPLTFQSTERKAARVVAGAPLAVGVGAAAAARTARRQLRSCRDDAHALQEELACVERTTASKPRT